MDKLTKYLIEPFLEKEVIDTYIKKFSKKSISASCEDYRAGASIDLFHHEKDNRKVSCTIAFIFF